MTLAECVTLWRDLTNEVVTTLPAEAQVYRYLNLALDAINRRVGLSVADDVAPFTLADGTQEYALPATLVHVLWVEWNGLPVHKTDQPTLRREAETAKNWRTRKGHPLLYYRSGRKLGFVAIPDAAAVALDNAPTLRAITTPNRVEAATSGLLLLSDNDHPVLVQYAAGIWLASPNGGFRKEEASVLLGTAEAEIKVMQGYYGLQGLEG
jgi:hypothetical protein